MALAASRSEGNLSVNPKLSDNRREKLINLKKREDLKDALTEKFKGRFGRNARARGDDEVSVASADIKKEVDRFAETADVTEANLSRLERRLHNKAKKDVDVASDAGVSAYSGNSVMSRRSRSVASLAGDAVIRGGSQTMPTVPETYDWAKLDEYASYLHEQDALRQKQGVVALQRKLRKDLGQQVAEKKARQDQSAEEDRRHHRNLLIELDRWKETEMARAEELKQKNMKEKADRDEQLAFDKKLRDAAKLKKEQEESALVEKIVTEMEAEQTRFEKKKEQAKRAMKKVFAENMEDMAKRREQEADQQRKDAEAMRMYQKMMDDQEQQRADEMEARLGRQKELMDKMKANVDQQAKASGDNDALRANKQQEEMDRHAYEAEKAKQERLKQMRYETQAYQLKQMHEKSHRNDEDKELANIQAMMLERDTEEYNEVERQKIIARKERNFKHRQEIEMQIAARAAASNPQMSDSEIKMNRGLLHLVDKTLHQRDQTRQVMLDEDEEDY